MVRRKLKVALGHPGLGYGGSEARVMWGIEALKDSYEVSLITTGEVDLARLNQYYGTNVQPHEITVLRVPLPSFILKMAGGDALRGALYGRFCRKVANQFDVLISTYNFCDFGVPAIHCLADFSWNEEIRTRSDPIPMGLRGVFHRHSIIRKGYLALVKTLASPSGRNLLSGEDLLLANSTWSAGIMKKKYGVDIEVLYPPVFDGFPEVPPDRKTWGFVCIGRISSEKRIEQILEILERVRRRGQNIHLHVIGKIDGTPYARKILRLSQEYGDWVFFEGTKFGENKAKILAWHRFGIHARKNEPFGISVAEMLKAGCITFVPKEGGQAEITNHPLLLYDSVEDAVKKIEAVLRQPDLQTELRDHLVRQSERFSTNRFIDEFRKAVEQFICMKNGVKKGAA
ncbi:MAG: glycosyltransferase family 4 protein [Deltaproteobacteria bacterium]|nr:glycosyltransferase family 4 protein [Deltaproteobacteria bacterium]